MIDQNSIDNDDSNIHQHMKEKGGGMNGNLRMSRMQNYAGAGISGQSVHQTNKLLNSDAGQDSENEFSPTKRTRAPRGRRMESLTARASALTPVEGVRFDRSIDETFISLYFSTNEYILFLFS